MRELVVALVVAIGVFVSATELNTPATAQTLVARALTDCTSGPCLAERPASTAPWAPDLEPITMFLGGTGMMGLGWVVWRRRLFGGARPVAGQMIVQNRISPPTQ